MSKLFTITLVSAVLFATADANAGMILAGQTTFRAKAIQDITLLGGTTINPGPDIFFDDLFGIGTATINREAQVGDTINISSLSGWVFFGSSPILGDYRFGIVGDFVGTDYSGQITNIVQDPSDPGFAGGDPSSFVSGDYSVSGPGFAFEFLSGPLAGAIVATDPAQTISFEAQFDGLPPSVGTTIVNSGEEVLNVLFNGELVATSSDRRIVVVPEPTAIATWALGVACLFLVGHRRNRLAPVRSPQGI